MKNYHAVPEGHQCLGSFREEGNFFLNNLKLQQLCLNETEKLKKC